MKNYKLIKQIFFILMFSCTAFSTNAGWIDDWTKQSTYSGPKYFEGQKRGYINAGSYSVRFDNAGSEYLFNVQKPSLSAGCGGIDFFMGGFSYMDPEYLMEKLQRALSMAPAVAFDLALKEMCQECSSTLAKFETFIEKLNAEQINECNLATGIATKAVELGKSLMATDLELGKNNDDVKNLEDHADAVEENENKPIQEQKESIEHCSVAFKEIYTQEGSLLENLTKTKGIKRYAPYMRAYVGDVLITYEDKQYGSKPIMPCDNMQVSEVDDMLSGNTKISDRSGECGVGQDAGLLGEVTKLMRSIAKKIKDQKPYTSDEENFINSMPMPVFNVLKGAVVSGSIDYYIAWLAEPTAKAMAFAITDDLIRVLREVTAMGDISADFSSSGTNDKCSPAVVKPIVDQVKKMKKTAAALALAVKKSKNEQTERYNNALAFNKAIEEIINNASLRQNQTDVQ